MSRRTHQRETAQRFYVEEYFKASPSALEEFKSEVSLFLRVEKVIGSPTAEIGRPRSGRPRLTEQQSEEQAAESDTFAAFEYPLASVAVRRAIPPAIGTKALLEMRQNKSNSVEVRRVLLVSSVQPEQLRCELLDIRRPQF